ncbi:MAG: hypothetical protein FJX67_11100 [Alphaproteobacteria bacterium]|nr:hypothetical protein [Alphaproteobacteria bacterium]
MATKSTDTIAGVRVPRRRFTIWAAIYFVLFVCVPVLGTTLILDVLIAVAVRHWLGVCYGVFCLFD